MIQTIPILWAAIIVFALVMYVSLDGFDLGIGILLLGIRDESERDIMVNSIAPIWDGNETWIVLLAVGLLGGFPIAYSIALPAFYPVLISMLLFLVFRGVAIEFRFQVVGRRYLVDYAFSLGSIGAALCQGMVLGGLVQGVKVENDAFAGGFLDFLHPLCLLTCAVLICAYTLLGATWLNYRMDDPYRNRFQRTAKKLLTSVAFLLLSLVVIVRHLEPRFGQNIPHALWTVWGIAVIAAGGLESYLLRRNIAIAAFLGAILICIISLSGLIGGLWPYVIPYAVTIWAGAAPTASQEILLTAALVVLPVILGYTSFAFYVFRGKVKAPEATY